MCKLFSNLKNLSSESCVSDFNNHEETFIYTEASPYGISVILLQKSRNQENCKIVAYSYKPSPLCRKKLFIT